MKIAHEQITRRLELELGPHAVTVGSEVLSSLLPHGSQPVICCIPETPEQLIAAMRLCSEAEAAMTPWGGGTAMGIGNSPRSVDVIVRLNRLNRVVEHDSANLTAMVEAGITLSTVNEFVGREKQFLSFDAPNASKATVGGTLAANVNGPRRSCYGSVRDLVTGMKVALVQVSILKRVARW